MSSLTINKLKAATKYNTSTGCCCNCSCCSSCSPVFPYPKKTLPEFRCPGKPSPNTLTPTESSRLSAELDQCPVYYVDGVAFVSSKSTAPVLIETTPASLTTVKLIESTLFQTTNSSDPAIRFSEFFPRQPPPPQFLQPEFRKYEINYEPVGPQSPCNSFRAFPA